jgi:hypothetical protein
MRLIGSGPDMEAVTTSKYVVSKEFVVSGGTIPRGGSGQGSFTPASERRERLAKRETGERAGERERASVREFSPDPVNVELGNAADELGIPRCCPVLIPLLAELLRESNDGSELSPRCQRIQEFLSLAIRTDTLNGPEKERAGELADSLFSNTRSG